MFIAAHAPHASPDPRERVLVSVWSLTLASVLLVSAIPLLGIVALYQREERLDRAVLYLVSFAVGAMLGGAILHLIPEAFARMGAGLSLSLYILLGFIGFFVLEKFLWAHTHRVAKTPDRRRHPLATLNLVGDGIHNLIDGMIIAAAYSADTSLGLATTLAVIFHEVPQEIGDFGVLVYGGLSVKRAVLFNLGSGLTAVLGAVLTLVVGRLAEGFTTALLPVAAGSFLYIAASDLVPELHRARQAPAAAWQIGLILLGVGLMCLPGLFG